MIAEWHISQGTTKPAPAPPAAANTVTPAALLQGGHVKDVTQDAVDFWFGSGMIHGS